MSGMAGWRGRIERVEDLGTHRFNRGAATDPRPRYAYRITLVDPASGELRVRRHDTRREAVEWCRDMGVELLSS